MTSEHLAQLKQTRYFEWQNTNSPRTDLALEAQELLQTQGLGDPGVQTTTEQTEHVLVTRVHIKNKETGIRIGKLPGHYVTLEAPAIRTRNQNALEALTQQIVAELGRFLHLEPEAGVLVAGLGNWDATPDALGPKVVSHLMVTRHLYNMCPPEVRGGLRPVSALAPGVLGLTGIETGEILQGVVAKTRPDAVIVIDALASRSTKRLVNTVQISDTGIQPGSGVGNRRFGITPESLGIPTIAIGVPTVVDAVTIASDALSKIHAPSQKLLSRGLEPQSGGLYDRQYLRQILPPELGTLMVTPKEIDLLIEDLAQMLANSLNAFLHPNLNLDNVLRYLQ